MSSVKRIKVAHNERGEATSSSSTDMKHIQDLPNDVFQHCLEFVGKGNFAFVAPVSKHFYWNYINLGVEMKNNVIDVDVILQQGRNKKTTAKDVLAASGLRLATECFLKAPKTFQEQVCREAAVNGRLDILKCAVAFVGLKESIFKYKEDDEDVQDGDDDELWSVMCGLLIEAAANNHLDVIEYLHNLGIHLDYYIQNNEDTDKLMDKCKASSLHWMNMTKGITSIFDTEIAKCLARDGEIDILKESYTEYIDYSTLCASAEAGNFEVFNWLQQEIDLNHKWTFDLFSKAVKGGSIPIMELCLRNGCPTGSALCVSAVQNKNDETALGALKWLREHNIRWDERVCTYAATYGNLKAIKWARESGCPWNRETYYSAAKYGTIEILDYCFENDCPVDPNIIYQMPFEDELFKPTENELQERSLKVYKWLHQHSIPWNEDASLVAAGKGHLETLIWAIENGCPYSLETIIYGATTRSNIVMLKYCLQYLAPTDVDIYVFALNKMCRRWWSSAIIEVLQMFRNNGIPWNREFIPSVERLGEPNVARWLRCVGCPE